MTKNKHWTRKVYRFWEQQTATLAAAIAFYTCLPVPISWTLAFRGIARLAPVIGLIIGGILGLLDSGLSLMGMPVLTQSVLVILVGIALTGGLHLDGAMDTADGLATPDPKRRLEVMSDSLTGAFGAMAAIAIILLKTAALHDIQTHRWLALMAVAGWGRWGQLVAIICYPYLKPSGKGAIHKESNLSARDLIPGLLLLLSLSGFLLIVDSDRWLMSVGMAFGGSAIAVLTGAWFNYKLGGHTGDTYGAVVEWTEALLLCLLAGIFPK